jgi:hypothetical protein
VNSLASQAACDQALGERTGDSNDGVKTTERETLNALEKSVFESATGKSVYRSDRRNSQASRDTPVHDVRAVPMRVNNCRAISAAHVGDERALAKVRASRHRKWHYVDTGFPERVQIRLIGVGRMVQDRRDAHWVSAVAMPDRQQAHDALQSPRIAGGDHVKNRQPIHCES